MDNLPIKKFKASILKVEVLALGVKKFTLKVSTPFSFEYWHYIWLEIILPGKGDPKGNRRAFSIVNLPNSDNTVEIVARISDSIYKQNMFALNEGEEVIIHGPFGSSFIVDDKSNKNIVMIAGGLGIAAFLPVLDSIKERGVPVKCFLVYLNRDEKSTPYIDTLKKFKRKNSSWFDYQISYERFTFSDISKTNLNTYENVRYFITGKQSMVDYVFTELENGGISVSNMEFENFYPTAKHDLTADKVKESLFTENLFVQAIENSTNHTVITNSNGVVLYANKAAQDITGYSFDEIIGNTPRLWGGMMSREFYIDFWEKKKTGEPFSGEIMNRRKNGEIYYAIGHIAPIFNSNKDLIGYIGTEEDVTEFKKQEISIKNNEQRLRFALEGSRDGLWDWNIKTDEVYFSPQWKLMLGFADNEIQGSVAEWEKRVYPADMPEVEKKLNAHLEGKTPYYESEHRVLCKDGSYKWILDRGLVTERDKDGKPLRAVGTHTDISASKDRENELSRLVQIMTGRELKMIELKEEIKRLNEKK